MTGGGPQQRRVLTLLSRLVLYPEATVCSILHLIPHLPLRHERRGNASHGHGLSVVANRGS